MSTSKPTINQYYADYDTPTPQNRFQRAVFNGRTAKAMDLISSGENVYVTTDLDESPLFISIARDHTAIANQILDVYEDDLRFVRQFFAEKHSIVWSEGPVFVAYGTDHCFLVNELSNGMQVLHGDLVDITKTMVILLKPSPSQERRILWLHPNSHSDNVNMAKIIECIWNDGVIDLQHIGHWGRTVFDVAAVRNQPEIYCRLSALSTESPEKLIENLLLMCRHYDDKLGFFKNIWSKTGLHFDIGDILSTNVDLFVLPAYNDLFEVFLFFMELLADRIQTEDSREAKMRNILSTSRVQGGSTIMDTIISADCKDFVQRCITYFKPNLVHRVANNRAILKILTAQTPSKFVTELVIEHFDQVISEGMEDQIVMQLIERNWLDAIKAVYDRYESSRTVLFCYSQQGLQCLLSAIERRRFELVDYLVDVHRDELTDPGGITELILGCSFVQRSHSVLRKLLALPAADVLRTANRNHHYKSCLYVALKFRHLDNFQLLLDNAKDLGRLRDLKEDNGENLLSVAIWFKENRVDESSFAPVEDKRVTLEVVDSSDDEEESCRKCARNDEIIASSSNPCHVPIMPDSFFSQQSAEMTRIFNCLLNELGLDYQCVNNTRETLLHVAVKRDNLDALKQLLQRGLDPNVSDISGNQPMHLVHSSAVMNVLRDHGCEANVTNRYDETPLLTFVKTIADGCENQASLEVFLVELLNAGANIHHTDANGLTVLHLVRSASVAQLLLRHGADINAKNDEDETPVLYAFRELGGHVAAQRVYKVFLCDPDIDLTVVSKKNVSILSVLVSLDNETMSEVLSSLTQRSKISDLENLFTLHCNSVDYHGKPVLMTACSEHTNSYCLDKLLDISHLNPNLHPAYQPLEADNKDIIKRLIDRGANVNGNGGGRRVTPLMRAIAGHTMAVSKSNFETFAVLLAAGADLRVTDADGYSALEYACRLENLKDARRILAALILANVNYHRNPDSDESSSIQVAPFNCLFLGF